MKGVTCRGNRQWLSISLYSPHTGYVSVHTSINPCCLLVCSSVPPLLIIHLNIHHLNLNCVHAVSTSNALPCCFWWWFTMYKFPLTCLSQRHNVFVILSLFIVETLNPLFLILQLHMFQICLHPVRIWDRTQKQKLEWWKQKYIYW